MRALIQRVSQAQVIVDQEMLAHIGPGLLVFLGVTHEDSLRDVAWIAGKTSRLRIFADLEGKMNQSVQDMGGSVLVVSQFTLYGDVRRGNRPGFGQAAPPEQAEALYLAYCEEMAHLGLPVQTGRFAADMQVSLVNDGPVTIWLDSSGQR